jgi:hypothetical protein
LVFEGGVAAGPVNQIRDIIGKFIPLAAGTAAVPPQESVAGGAELGVLPIAGPMSLDVRRAGGGGG